MAIKWTDRKEEKEFQEILEAFHEYYEKLIANPDSESGSLVFWTDQRGEIVFIRCSDDDHGSISSAEFQEIKNQIGKECLVCTGLGLLELIFESKSKPVLYLVCNQCEAVHRVVLGELCLSDY